MISRENELFKIDTNLIILKTLTQGWLWYYKNVDTKSIEAISETLRWLHAQTYTLNDFHTWIHWLAGTAR